MRLADRSWMRRTIASLIVPPSRAAAAPLGLHLRPPALGTDRSRLTRAPEGVKLNGSFQRRTVRQMRCPVLLTRYRDRSGVSLPGTFGIPLRLQALVLPPLA